jgi:hypothetical protein
MQGTQENFLSVQQRVLSEPKRLAFEACKSLYEHFLAM